MKGNYSKVNIPTQLVGSGEQLLEMHPDQYIIDGLGDKILYLRTRGMTNEEILENLPKTISFPVSRLETFLILAERKIWYHLTGEVNRNFEEIKRKIAVLTDHAKHLR